MISPRLRVATMYLGAAVAIAAVGLLRQRTPRTPPPLPPSTSDASTASAHVLARTAAEGHNVRAATTVAFVLYFPAEQRARAAAAALARAGWAAPAVEQPDEPGGSWQVSVTRHMAPTLRGLDSVEQALRPVARRFGGEYDGWEADVRR